MTFFALVLLLPRRSLTRPLGADPPTTPARLSFARLPVSHAHETVARSPPTPINRGTQVSFGSILTPLGVGLLVYGFGAFIGALPGADLSSVILIYGFPIALLGFALSYAQLEPVPCVTTAGAAAAREASATDIQKQLRDDVTRYRYGDEQHLEEALARVWAFGRQGGIPRRLCPTLVGVREERTGPDRAYTLVLEFSCKPELAPDAWEARLPKIESFFGPGIKASLAATPGKGMDVALAVDGSGAGRGGPAQKDVLMPLVPGAPARRQD